LSQEFVEYFFRLRRHAAPYRFVGMMSERDGEFLRHPVVVNVCHPYFARFTNLICGNFFSKLVCTVTASLV